MWTASNLQLVGFLAAPEEHESAELYKAITGSKPLQYQGGSGGFGMPMVGSASGVFEGVGFTVQAQLGRVDLFVMPHFPQGLPTSPYIAFDDFEKVMQTIEPAFKQLLQKVGELSRVGIVAQLSEQAASLADANRKLADLIGVDLADGEVQDLSFTVNRRMHLEQGVDLTLNRLVTWSVGMMQQVMMGMPPGVMAGGPQPFHFGMAPGVQTFYSSQVSVDINTAPELTGGTFGPDKAAQIVHSAFNYIRNFADNPVLSALDK